jgi:hypothetical protein
MQGTTEISPFVSKLLLAYNNECSIVVCTPSYSSESSRNKAVPQSIDLF